VTQDKPVNHPIRLSVLDRLIDYRPGLHSEPERSPNQVLALAIEAVRRDLQHLLNSRLSWVDDHVTAHAEVRRSITAFGIPDFTHENIENSDSRERIRAAIEQAIATFEPRLTNVAVKAETLRPHERSLRYRIESVLWVDPLREPVTFDTVLQSTGVAEVVAV
jgi:type VI secretion system protein ImpF